MRRSGIEVKLCRHITAGFYCYAYNRGSNLAAFLTAMTSNHLFAHSSQSVHSGTLDSNHIDTIDMASEYNI